MKVFITMYSSINESGEIVRFEGERVISPSFSLAEDYCRKHAPHLTVLGELISVVPTKDDNITPDWGNEVDYEKPDLN